jgi:hypothetical protein
MVSSNYLLRKPTPPSDLKRFFDQRIMPVAIDGAACLDIGLAKTVEHVRRNPAVALGLAAGMGVLLAAWLGPRGSRTG